MKKIKRIEKMRQEKNHIFEVILIKDENIRVDLNKKSIVWIKFINTKKLPNNGHYDLLNRVFI